MMHFSPSSFFYPCHGKVSQKWGMEKKIRRGERERERIYPNNPVLLTKQTPFTTLRRGAVGSLFYCCITGNRKYNGFDRLDPMDKIKEAYPDRKSVV